MQPLIEEDLTRVNETETRAWGRGVLIRRSAPGDGAALNALAALDDREWAGGPALVAEIDGALEAALPLDGSGSFADPFAKTAEVVALLQLRAEQLGLVKRRRWVFAH